MQQFVEFHFKPDVLGQFSLPPIGYPMPVDFARQLASGDHEVPFELMLFWLQQKSADSGADWMDMEPAMRRLIDLVAPGCDRQSVIAEGDTWQLEIGFVDLDQQVVTIERDHCLLAALRPDEEGRLLAASYRPLDADSLLLLMRLATRPHSRHGVAMCPNNWEYALDSTVTTDNFYASEHHESCLSYFRYGVRDDEIDLDAPSHTAAQLDIYRRFSAMTH